MTSGQASTPPEQPLSQATRAKELAIAPLPGLTAQTSCAEAARLMSAASPRPLNATGVPDSGGKLLGMAALSDCLSAAPETPLAEILQPAAASIRPDKPARIAARTLVDRDLAVLPVVDAHGRLTGLVSHPQALRFLLERAEEDLHDFAGLSGEPEDDYGRMSVWADFMRRAPWVLMLAVAGLAAGYVVHVYEDALDALVILALYMPMVADTGGNVGTQSASLVTRAISSGGQVHPSALRILWREMRVSLMMAAALFLFAFLKVQLISNPADVPEGLTLTSIALAIGIALAAQVVSATLIGAALPLGAVAARLDPAVVSGPALTTIVDLTGLILYFGLTTHFLGLSAPVY